MNEYEITIKTNIFLNHKEKLEIAKIIDKYLENIKKNRKKCKCWKLKF